MTLIEQAYLALLQLPFNHTFRVCNQEVYGILRDNISSASLPYQSSEEIQNRFEEIAYKICNIHNKEK